MSGKTKIVVLHKKELFYTILFAAIGIITAVVLIVLFSGCNGDRKKDNNTKQPPTTQGDAQETMSSDTGGMYEPGVYHSVMTLGESAMEMEVVIDEERIHSAGLKQLNDSVSAMYPLVEPAMEELEQQLLEQQDATKLTYSEDSRYTSMMLLNTLEHTLEKAKR